MHASSHGSVLLAGYLLTGCAVSTVVSISEPHFFDSAQHSAALDPSGILRIGDLSISIKPQNARGSLAAVGPLIPLIPTGRGDQLGKGKLFEVVIQFETSDAAYTFMAGDTTLVHGEVEYRPTQSTAPLGYTRVAHAIHRASRGHDWICDEVIRLRPDLLLSDVPVLRPRSCLVLQFPVLTLSPEQRFHLELRGLKKDGRAVELPRIEFRPGTTGVYSIHGSAQSNNRLYTDARKSSARG
jgi:hypothetical protein